MNIFQYLFYLGIIQVLYSFIFQWASLALSFILVILKLEKWGAYILKTINYYLYISLLGILTLTALNGVSSIPYLLLIIGTGLFFAFTTIGGGMYEGQKEAQQNYNYLAIEMMKYDTYFLFGSLGYFIVVLFVPTIANTLPVQLIFIVIDWVYKLPIIGFLVGIYGLFTVFGTLFQAFIMGGAGAYLIFSKLRGKKEEKENSSVVSQEENIIEVSEENETTPSVYSTPLYDADKRDEIYPEVKEFIIDKNEVTVSDLMKKFDIGYSRGARIMDHLEQDGLVGDSEGGGKPRIVLNNDLLGAKIVECLKAFGIQTKISEINHKKSGIEYCLDVALGSPMEEIVKRERDIAAIVESPTGKVKIQAPIPKRSQVGILIPYLNKV